MLNQGRHLQGFLRGSKVEMKTPFCSEWLNISTLLSSDFVHHDLEQNYIPLLKVLICDINGFEVQEYYGCMFVLSLTSLKMAVLLWYLTVHESTTRNLLLFAKF